MKIVIFGASSKTGLLLVQQTIDAGHEVTAFAREPSKITIQDDHLNIIQGDALKPAQVSDSIQGQEAVLSLIGPTKGAPKNLTSECTRNILEGMQDHNVKRLVLTSVAGIPTPNDETSGASKFIGSLLKIFLKDMFLDRENQLALLESSDREWVAIRLPRLTDDKPAGQYQLGFKNPGMRLKISRANLAAAMLDQLSEDSYLRQAPIISQV
jgi:putative NADH-flavin reductase